MTVVAGVTARGPRGDFPDEGSAAAVRDAMACLAAPVTVVTMVDGAGRPLGFTASAVCSLSLRPPLLLVSVAETSSCHQAMSTVPDFVVNVLGAEHRELAARFARHGADRYAGGELVCDGGPPYLPDAIALFRCEVHERLAMGDHLLVVGRVVDIVAHGGREPLVWYQRSFGTSAD